MNAAQLESHASSLKEHKTVDAALITLRARGARRKASRAVETGPALVEAGLHPATGGDGTFVCSGDMLLRRWSRAPA